jgi:hypothetical protein
VLHQQGAHLVAGQLPPAGGLVDGPRAGSGTGHAAPVGVGVDRDDEVRAGTGGEVQRQVEGAGLLGVGERHGGEVRVRLGLLGHRGHLGDAGAGEHAGEHACPTPCMAVVTTRRSRGPGASRPTTAST